MKRIVIAPDSFKESIDAQKAAAAIALGFQNVFPDLDIITVPMADGGEGIVRTLVAGRGGRLLKNRVTGPLGEPVDAEWGILEHEKTCIIEMASASGLPLVPLELRNPMLTTTYGTGELIKHALDTNCERIIVGIGGSATNDGGAGMAQALGARLLDSNGKQIGYGAQGLRDLSRIDVAELDPRLGQVEIIVAMDVQNPLCGPTGASYVYAPQKGATPEMLPVLDSILTHYANLILRDLHIDVMQLPGSGAAGGLGAGLLAFLGAQTKPGVDVVLELVNMEGILRNDVDLVITGEGQINQQTAYGKVPVGVARLAKRYGIPVVALVGSIGENAQAVLACGIDAYFSLVPEPMTLESCMKRSEELLTDLAEQCARMIRALYTKGGL